MSNSIRKGLLRGVGFAAASGALLASPSFAGTEPGAEQLRLEPQAAPATEVAQGYGSPTTVEVVEVESVNGWYLTVGAGAAWPTTMGFRTSDVFPGDEPSGDFSFGGGFSIDGGVGYDFGALRAELTYGYTRSSLNEVNINNSNYNFSGSGIINKNDVMGSLYWDIDTNSRFVPYLGGGIGYTNLSTPSFTVDGYRTDSASRGLFGWQAKVGVSYIMSYNTDVYLEGTYSGASGFYNGDVHYNSYNDFGAKLGFRYRFASPEVVVIAPEPQPEPAPAPMPQPEPEPAPAPIRGLW
ncbi:outer membrane beta-barrel protein [Cyanobium sp. FGCU-52]|nr:outer membrane beta-barrel protein [Cyanobium sp. FGCU52]